MSCKSNLNISSSKNKHYTLMERKVFLQILNLFKHIIEVKKSDGTTIKEKETAWNEICNRYNESALISQERTVQQLKKLWTNIKQGQREAITKERQSRMATGGGPEQSEATVDPDVAVIAPHLMKTAPVLFTSNMTEKEINDTRDTVLEFVPISDNVQLLDHEDDAIDIVSDTGTIMSKDISTIEDNVKQYSKKSIVLDEQCGIVEGNVELHLSSNDKKRTSCIKEKKRKITELDAEENIRIERIKQIMQQEESLASIKLKHEERIAVIREDHLREMNYLERKHLKEIHEEEIKIRRTRLRSIGLQQKENIEPDT